MSPETATKTAFDEGVENVARSLPARAHWLLRAGLAAIVLYHGFSKFSTIDAFAADFDLPTLVAYLVAYTETAAGLLLIVGAFRTPFADGATRLGGALVIPVMLGAIVKAHWPRWNFAPDEAAGFPMGGMEFQVLIIGVGLYFVLRGSPSTP